MCNSLLLTCNVHVLLALLNGARRTRDRRRAGRDRTCERGEFREATRTDKPACGWRCPYELIRSAMTYRRHLVRAAHDFLGAARARHALLGVAQQRGELTNGLVHEYASGDMPLDTSSLGHPSIAGVGGAAADRVRVLAVHWRRGDFLSRAGMEQACFDEATGERLVDGTSGTPCVRAAVVLSPEKLAYEVLASLGRHNASLVFLASNAKAEEVAALEAALPGTPVIRYQPPPGSSSAEPAAGSAAPRFSAPELAVIDTLVCALADAFLGTRRSMFSWNILEERVLQGRHPETGALMGLPASTRRAGGR